MKLNFTICFLALFIAFGCKNEPTCFFDENNAGKKTYDLDEATCFISLKLKSPNLELIRNALKAEEAWMKKIELISKEPIPANRIDSITELDLNDLVEFVTNNYDIELTKNKLLEVYKTETEYLEFIGVVDEL